MQQNSKLVRGLYEPGEFRDNCGFGLIAHMEGNASHELLHCTFLALTARREGNPRSGNEGALAPFSFKINEDTFPHQFHCLVPGNICCAPGGPLRRNTP